MARKYQRVLGISVSGDWEQIYALLGRGGFEKLFLYAAQRSFEAAARFTVMELKRYMRDSNRTQARIGRLQTRIRANEGRPTHPPLVDTGALINSVAYEMHLFAANVGFQRQPGSRVDPTMVLEHGARIRLTSKMLFKVLFRAGLISRCNKDDIAKWYNWVKTQLNERKYWRIKPRKFVLRFIRDGKFIEQLHRVTAEEFHSSFREGMWRAGVQTHRYAN